ncbi:MAG: SDR family NAD(P)-dependent oxidoreductase, partial [bacterium]
MDKATSTEKIAAKDWAKEYSGVSVLITGAAGFIGSHLTEALADGGAIITTLDNFKAGYRRNLDDVRERITEREGDVRNPEFVQALLAEIAPQVIFHLAANASVPGSVQEPAYDYEANAVGTFVILEAARKVLGKNVAKIITTSSGAVYGEPTSFPIKEQDTLQPISPYGASKLCAEVSSRMFHRVYQSPVTIARLFNTYGPRMARFVVLDFLRKLKADPGRLEILGTGRQVRDFTYVADTVQGFLVLGMLGAEGEAYNVSSGTSCSVTELAHALIAARGLT